MTNPTPVVVDLSHWDPAQDYAAVKKAGIVGVIYKATEGTGYTDPTYVQQQKGAKALGLKWGAYHFANSSDATQQANNFLKFAFPDSDELFCLDWEDNGGDTMSLEQARQWIQIVEAELGRPGECVIYSGNTAKEALGNKNDPFFGSRRLWLAQYGPTPVCQKSWASYWLWQYSETGSIPGINGDCDVNHYDGSPDELVAQWATGSITPAPPATNVVTVMIDAPPGVYVKVVNVNDRHERKRARSETDA